MDYDNVNDLCDKLQFELKHIHDLSDYIGNGQNCAQKFSTMNKIKLFISWMSTRMKNKTMHPSSEYLLVLAYEQFNDFMQAHMIRMIELPTAPPPGPNILIAPHASQSSGSKKKAFLPNIMIYLMNLFVNLLKKSHFTCMN